MGEDRDSARVFDEADGLLRVEPLLFDKSDAAVAQVLGEGLGEVADVLLVHKRHGDVRSANDLALAVRMDLLVGDVNAEGVQFFDNRLGAGDSLLGEVLEFHVEGEVRGVAEVTQDVDVLALPNGRNLDARDDFESDFFGGFRSQLVTVEVVVVGNRDAAEPLALAKSQ